MTEEQLYKANKITKEIKLIEDFLDSAKQVWTGKIVSANYGIYKSKEYEMDTETKNEVLEVLENKLERFKEELHNL
ncbi:hypothetical protein [Viridibacillus arvi]|uniref:hypothetical protein n=1 Tax=Viridibacillus arvi TaxID=263475 RepID=UPI003D2C317B